MELGFVGLGRMGMNMVTRLLDGGHKVTVYNRSPDKVQIAAERGAIPSDSLENLVSKLSKLRIIWLMIPAGQPTEEVIQQLIPLLNPDDILIDGGNAFYKDSMRRAEQLAQHKIHFLDIGVSGGIWGLEKGYCMMAGGEETVFHKVEPILKTLAPKDGYAYIDKHGSGHFVKMVHNGIEYAMLQAYGEGFEIIHAKSDFDVDMAKLSYLWNQGSVIRSWLLELAESAFEEDAHLDAIKGFVEDSGEGRWTVAAAIEEDVPAPTITLSLLERFRSRQKESFSAKVIAALRNKFGGHKIKT